MLKRVELERGLIHSWLELPDYIEKENDVHFPWSPIFNYDTMYDVLREWKKNCGPIEIFEIINVYREPSYDFDTHFRQILKKSLVARCDTITNAILWKIKFDV